MDILLFYSLILCNEYIFLSRSYNKKIKKSNNPFVIIKFDIFEGIKVEELDDNSILKEDFDKLIVNDALKYPGILKLFYNNEIENKLYKSHIFFNNKILDQSRIFLVRLFGKLQKIISASEDEKERIIKRFLKEKTAHVDLCESCRKFAVQFIKNINFYPETNEKYLDYLIKILVTFIVENFSAKTNKAAIEHFLQLKANEIFFMDNELLNKFERLNYVLYDKFIFTDKELQVFNVATEEKTFKLQVINN